MAAAISPGAGRAYGVGRVCDGLGVARSSFYAWRRQQERSDPLPSPARRGPKPAISDAAVLSAIRADLARSPWIGEGHRKVWARLRVLDGLRVARKRVLRLMRENGLLSPHRHLPRTGEAHDGRITTDAPNLMWGTDATQIPTVQDGKVWLFAKDKNKDANRDLYFEMNETIRTETFDPTKLRPVNVEGRAKTLLEYLPLISVDSKK